MALYDQFAKAASQLLASELGGTFTLRRITGPGYDPDTGVEVPATQNDKRVRGVIKSKDVWNAGAYLGRKLVAVLDNKVEPRPDDRLISGTKTYTITTVTTNAPNGTTVISYEVGLA